MKNSIISTLLSFAVFSTFLLFSCEEKCTNCPQSSKCNNGVCICEDGGYMFNSNCVQLGDNSYIGINAECYCYDTMIISIVGQGENRTLGMAFKYGDQVGTQSQSVYYYEQSSGDSLWSPQLDLRCFASDNTPLKPAAYGKKQPDGSWKIRLEFQDALTFEVVDNCVMTLKKFE